MPTLHPLIIELILASIAAIATSAAILLGMNAAAAEYRESLALARRMAEDPEVAEDWARHQAGYVPMDDIEEAAEVEVAAESQLMPLRTRYA